MFNAIAAFPTDHPEGWPSTDAADMPDADMDRARKTPMMVKFSFFIKVKFKMNHTPHLPSGIARTADTTLKY